MENVYEEYYGYSSEVLQGAINDIDKKLVTLGNLFEAYCKQSSDTEASIDSKTRHIAAQKELVDIIKEQINLNQSLVQDKGDADDRSILDQHRESLERLLDDQIEKKELWEKKLKQLKAQLKQTERELNITVKPNFSDLSHRKNIMIHILKERGFELSQLSRNNGDVTDSTSENKAPSHLSRVSIEDPRAWLMESCTREQSIDLLRNKPHNTFLIRASSSSPHHPYAVSVVSNNKVHHLRIIQEDNYYGFHETCIVHPDLGSLVRHYSQHSLEVYNGILKDTYLKYPLNMDQSHFN